MDKILIIASLYLVVIPIIFIQVKKNNNSIILKTPFWVCSSLLGAFGIFVSLNALYSFVGANVAFHIILGIGVLILLLIMITSKLIIEKSILSKIAMGIGVILIFLSIMPIIIDYDYESLVLSIIAFVGAYIILSIPCDYVLNKIKNRNRQPDR